MKQSVKGKRETFLEKSEGDETTLVSLISDITRAYGSV